MNTTVKQDTETAANQITKSQVIGGLKWSGISQVFTQAIAFGFGIVLARLLSPRDYGLIGMVLVFTGFATIFVDMGLGSALVQRKQLEEKHINTVFFINIVAGTFLTLLMFFSAPYIAAFYNEPKLKAITQVLSVNFFLGSLISVQRALLTKSLDFKKLSKVDIGTTLLASTISVTLAILGYGVWSIVCQYIATRVLTAVIVWRLSKWKPRPYFRRDAFRQLLGYSSNLVGFEMLNYWVRNLDNLLIGRYISSAALGIYTRAYSLMLLPITQITTVISKVMFPALSAIQDDKAKVKQIYLRAINMISFITFPLMIGLFVVSDYFIVTVYGSKWQEVIPILQLLCFVGLSQSVTSSVGWIFNSQGKTNIQLRWGIFSSVFRCISFIVGLKWGVQGIALAYLLGTIILAPISMILAGRIIDLSLPEIIKKLTPNFLMAGAMGVCVFFLKTIIPIDSNSLKLLILVFCGFIIYAGVAFFLKAGSLMEISVLIKRKKKVVPDPGIA